MPGGDRTGPRGEGARTGRAAGYCSGYDSPGYMNVGVGYGGRGMRGRAGGFGRGYRHIFYATGLPRWMRGGRRQWPFYADVYPEELAGPAGLKDDIGSLRREADILEERLRAVTERIKDLESDQEKDNG
jgi:hypothetical protein